MYAFATAGVKLTNHRTRYKTGCSACQAGPKESLS
jgi:hypothetical protein